MKESLYGNHEAEVNQSVLAGHRAVLPVIFWDCSSGGVSDVLVYWRGEYHQRGIAVSDDEPHLSSNGVVPV